MRHASSAPHNAPAQPAELAPWSSYPLTLIESCKAADVELVPYLTDVLVRVATHPASAIDDLTPAGWRVLDLTGTAD